VNLRCLTACFTAALAAAAPTSAAPGSKCRSAPLILWGDGVHDDSAALNAWFRGDEVVWAQSGRAVGPQIADRVFRLRATLYIPSGTDRSIERFQLIWPERRERVSGGTILTGGDPKKPPVAIAISKIGAGPGEGVPFPILDPKPANDNSGTDCLVS
jgi:hypothetical protein